MLTFKLTNLVSLRDADADCGFVHFVAERPMVNAHCFCGIPMKTSLQLFRSDINFDTKNLGRHIDGGLDPFIGLNLKEHPSKYES